MSKKAETIAPPLVVTHESTAERLHARVRIIVEVDDLDWFPAEGFGGQLNTERAFRAGKLTRLIKHAAVEAIAATKAQLREVKPAEPSERAAADPVNSSPRATDTGRHDGPASGSWPGPTDGVIGSGVSS